MAWAVRVVWNAIDKAAPSLIVMGVLSLPPILWRSCQRVIELTKSVRITANYLADHECLDAEQMAALEAMRREFDERNE